MKIKHFREKFTHSKSVYCDLLPSICKSFKLYGNSITETLDVLRLILSNFFLIQTKWKFLKTFHFIISGFFWQFFHIFIMFRRQYRQNGERKFCSVIFLVHILPSYFVFETFPISTPLQDYFYFILLLFHVSAMKKWVLEGDRGRWERNSRTHFGGWIVVGRVEVKNLRDFFAFLLSRARSVSWII